MATDPQIPGQDKGGWGNFKDGKVVGERDLTPRLVAAGVALVLAVIFVVQNSSSVDTKFLLFDGTFKLWVVILVSIVLGAVLGQVAEFLFHRRKKS